MPLASAIGELKFLAAATVFHLVALPGAAAIAPRPASSAVAAKGETGEIQIDVDTAILPPRPEDQVYDPTMPRAPDDAMAYAESLSHEWGRQSRQHLEQLPATPTRDRLQEMLEFFVQRAF